MFDESKLRKKLKWLLSQARYTSLSTGRRERLIDEFVEAAKESEIAEVEAAAEGPAPE